MRLPSQKDRTIRLRDIKSIEKKPSKYTKGTREK